jgi:hypothetical protein
LNILQVLRYGCCKSHVIFRTIQFFFSCVRLQLVCPIRFVVIDTNYSTTDLLTLSHCNSFVVFSKVFLPEQMTRTNMNTIRSWWIVTAVTFMGTMTMTTNTIPMGVDAYRPSSYTSVPTTTTASDIAVANYMRKRYNVNPNPNSHNSTSSILPTMNTVVDSPTNYNTVLPVSSLTAAAASTLSRSSRRSRPQRYQKWGVDHQYPNEYWFDSRIHTLGNHGFWGAVHAALAPVSTKIIDLVAYNGIDIRKQVMFSVDCHVSLEQQG